MKLVTDQQAKRLIRKHIRTSAKSRLAVAFWGDGACEKLDLNADTVSVICNLSMGGTNPHEIVEMQRLGITVKQCDGLHAKVYLFDNGVLIGSSNASSNGLSFQDDEGPNWIEANVFSDDPDLIASASNWMAMLPTREITRNDIATAIEIWERRRATIAGTVNGGRSIVETMRDAPTTFDGKNVFVCFYSQEMNKEGEDGFAAIQERSGESIDAFQDWPALPATGILLCFKIGRRGGLRYDGCVMRQRNLPDIQLENSTLQLSLIVPDRPDLKIHSKDLADWRIIYQKIRNSEYWDEGDGSAVVNLGEVSRHFLPR